MSTLKTAIEEIIRSLCDFPSAVSIDWFEKDGSIYLDVSPSKEDVRHLIGKNGNIANAIRTILHAAHAKEKKKTYLTIRA